MSCDAVIDSYAWIEYFKGTESGKRAEGYIEAGNCATPTIVLAELSDKYHREGPEILGRRFRVHTRKDRNYRFE